MAARALSPRLPRWDRRRQFLATSTSLVVLSLESSSPLFLVSLPTSRRHPRKVRSLTGFLRSLVSPRSSPGDPSASLTSSSAGPGRFRATLSRNLPSVRTPVSSAPTLVFFSTFSSSLRSSGLPSGLPEASLTPTTSLSHTSPPQSS